AEERAVTFNADPPTGVGGLCQKDDTMSEPLLRVEDLTVSFSGEGGRVRAVNGVNLSIYPRQTLAVVGESGCGKSVTALSILRLVPTPPGRYDAGRIVWRPDAEQGDAGERGGV